jgi:hypothetical protein
LERKHYRSNSGKERQKMPGKAVNLNDATLKKIVYFFIPGSCKEAKAEEANLLSGSIHCGTY